MYRPPVRAQERLPTPGHAAQPLEVASISGLIDGWGTRVDTLRGGMGVWTGNGLATAIFVPPREVHERA